METVSDRALLATGGPGVSNKAVWSRAGLHHSTLQLWQHLYKCLSEISITQVLLPPIAPKTFITTFSFKSYFTINFGDGSHYIALCCPGTHCVYQVDLDFTEISLSLSPECWAKRYVPTYMTIITSFETCNILISLSSPGTLKWCYPD